MQWLAAVEGPGLLELRNMEDGEFRSQQGGQAPKQPCQSF